MMGKLFKCLPLMVCVLIFSTKGSKHDLLLTCDSQIYCSGLLLHTVQMAGIFPDSKSFVDMAMLDDPKIILADFQQLMLDNNNSLCKQQVLTFVNNKFTFGNELENWVPKDYNPNPTFLEKIIDPEAHLFAQTVISIWPHLSRKVNRSVTLQPQRYSIIPLPNGIIIPGGRFRESYYWDSYWIIKGLLISEMHETVRGLLDNFVHLIKIYGFIPNGGRIYYTRRSQPPLFTMMCMEYFKYTGDIQWLHDNVDYIEAELTYWQKHKMIKVQGKYMMAHYLPKSAGPRPESYKEDYLVASNFPDAEKQRVYEDLKGAAESGWDFSSRWFYHDARLKPTGGNLSQINTRRSLPVDLNSYLCKAFGDLAHFYSVLGNSTKQAYWFSKHVKMQYAIFDVFWNDTDGTWYDFDMKLQRHRNAFYISNLTPLWAGIEHTDHIHDQVYAYLDDNKIFDYLGGTPTSLQNTGEQWDSPNAWAPLQDIIITALQRGKSKKSQSMAARLAKLWLRANMIGYQESGELYEKYDAIVPGRYGGGGEYTVQAGFGWTNGFALDLIHRFLTRK